MPSVTYEPASAADTSAATARRRTHGGHGPGREGQPRQALRARDVPAGLRRGRAHRGAAHRVPSRKLFRSRCRQLGVATFYNFFSLQPKAEHTALVCTGTACYVAGAKGLLDVARHRCERATARGAPRKLGVQQARCIGSCGLAPVVVLDGRILPKLSVSGLETSLDEVGA